MMKLSRLQNIALYLFFFSINFEEWDPLNTSGFFSVSKLTGFIYFFTILPHIKQYFFIHKLKSFLIPVWLFFGLLTAVSIVNINNVSARFFDFSIFQNILLLWILVNHERKVPGILGKALLSFALGSIILALLFYAGIGIKYEGGRVSLFGDNENTIGMRMSISMIILLLAVFLNQFKLDKIRFILLAAIPIMLRLMADTGSRVAFISFVLMFLTAGFLFKTRKKWYKIAFLMGALCAFSIVIQYIMQSKILVTRLAMAEKKGDLAGRDIIWQKLISLIKENPIFGVGQTGYAEYSLSIFSHIKSPHNVIIEVLCYSGVMGFIFYFLFLFRVGKQAFSAYKSNNMLLPLLLLIPMAGYLLSGQILTSKIGWAIFSYSIAAGLFSARDNRSAIFIKNSK